MTPKMKVAADSCAVGHKRVRMARLALLSTLVVAFLCGGCSVSVPSQSERALETEVARLATQVAELQREQREPSPTPPVGAPVLPTPTPMITVSAPSATPAGPSPTVAPGAMPTHAGPAAQACEMVAETEVTVYDRASPSATVFGSMYPGLRVMVKGRTADGWLGFEPAVAQAANIGIFRLRWVHESSAIRLEGTCDELPELVGPLPGFCFTMPMEEVAIYAEPDGSSEVLATLSVGDYAAVLGITRNAWARVDLSLGNTGSNLSGWVQEATLNLNGPCDRLPTVEP